MLIDNSYLDSVKPRPKIENTFTGFLAGRKRLEEGEISQSANEKPCTDESFDCIVESTVPNDEDWAWSSPAGDTSTPEIDPLAHVSHKYMVSNGYSP